MPEVPPTGNENRVDQLTIGGGVVKVLRARALGRNVYEAEWVGAVPAGMPARLAWKEIDLTVGGETLPRERLAYEALNHGDPLVDGGQIVRSVGFAEVGGFRYHVMELVGPTSLAVSRRIYESQRSELVRRVLVGGHAALYALRDHDVWHRDVHPGNLMARVKDGPALLPEAFVLGDLGHAYVLDERSGEVPTFVKGEPKLVGQMSVQSPEVIEGDSPRTFDDDLFSLAMTAYILARHDHLTAWRGPDGSYFAYDTDRPSNYTLTPAPERLAALDPEMSKAILLMLAPTRAERSRNLARISELLAPAPAPAKPTVFAVEIDRSPAPGLFDGYEEVDDVNRPGLVRVADFRAQPLSTRRLKLRLREQHRLAVAYVVIVLLPVVVAAILLLVPGVGALPIQALVGVPPGVTVASIVLVGIAVVAIVIFGFVAVTGREWMRGTIAQCARSGSLLTLAAVASFAYAPTGTIALESWILRAGALGLDWYVPYWNVAQWILVVATVAAVIWLICFAWVTRRTAAGTLKAVIPANQRRAVAWLGLIPAAMAVSGLIAGLIAVAPFPAPGAQGAADCGATPFRFTAATDSMCVSASNDWVQLTGDSFTSDDYVTYRGWSETPELGVDGSTVLALQSRAYPCLTAYFTTYPGIRGALSEHLTLNLGSDRKMTVSRTDDDGNVRRTLLGNVQYAVYGSLKDDGASWYYATTIGAADNEANYGRTQAIARFIADHCDSAASAAADSAARTLMNGVRVRDTGYVDQMLFQRDTVALSALGLSITDLRVPLTTRLSSANNTDRLSEYANGELAASVPVILDSTYREYPFALVKFWTTQPDGVANSVASDFSGWTRDSTPSAPDENGVSQQLYYRTLTVRDTFVYLTVTVWARLDSDNNNSLEPALRDLLSGIKID